MLKLALMCALMVPTVMWAADASAAAPLSLPEDAKLEAATHPVVLLTVPAGQIWIELFPETAPKHVESFLSLIGKGYYNGLTFHRVEPGFVIQGGCPDGTGTGGPGYTIPGEFSKTRHHVKGTLAMARTSDPDSAGSQFYICLDRIPHLDGNYTIFGQVVKGLDVPEQVKRGDKMKIEIVQKGK